MQYAKDEIRQRIIDVARQEFLKKGFENASIRTITSISKTSKSNLYNYFDDKNNLFYAVLETTTDKINNGLELANILNSSTEINSYTKENQENNINIVMQFVYENIDDIKLLLFHSQGSSLANFKNSVVDTFSDILLEWIERNFPEKKISKFFVKCISNFYLSIIEQVILDKVSKEQIEKQHNEFIDFIYYGWKGVFQQK